MKHFIVTEELLFTSAERKRLVFYLLNRLFYRFLKTNHFWRVVLGDIELGDMTDHNVTMFVFLSLSQALWHYDW